MKKEYYLQVWESFEAVRRKSPLVHNITNFVAMNNTANALLAAGASPVMAHAPEEVEEMVTLANALVINIGTLNAEWISAMQKAMVQAKVTQTPIVIDPVGAGATSFRTQTVKALLALATPAVIRGNASEIRSLVDTKVQTKGVESTDTTDAAVGSGLTLSKQYRCTVVISGETDYVINQNHILKVKNGSPMMTRITGMGCAATALIGAFVAVQENYFDAAVHAMGIMGVAGEVAALDARGPGSLEVAFLDRLYSLDKAILKKYLRVEA